MQCMLDIKSPTDKALYNTYVGTPACLFVLNYDVLIVI
jgi:hypothetical protein